MKQRRSSLLGPKRRKGPPPEFRVLRCPEVGHQASWCHMLCEPVDGKGTCGRAAPHIMTDRTQRAIKKYIKRTRGEVVQIGTGRL